MRRLWGRVAVRTLAVLLLAFGVAGGLYLGGGAPDTRGGMDDARAAGLGFLHAAAEQRAAEQDAKNKAMAEAQALAARARAAEEAVRRNQAASRARAELGPIPASCSVYQGNRAVGCTLLLQSGFGLDQMPCLDKLWTKESGWSTTATNRSSGAYGIPQALPGSKMSKFGDDWRTNPATQIKWGLDYIKGRYGTPCGAWSFFQSRGWY
ncbi:MAG: lytic transglycosylase domain-containing protein [Micromonosporaceae bacterium]